MCVCVCVCRGNPKPQKTSIYIYIYIYVCVCGKELRGDFRAGGQGLCATCQPAKCTEEGCGARLIKSWRFVGKCRVHGGREGV